jgi:hypothetical protein
LSDSIPSKEDFQLFPIRSQDLDGWSAWEHFGGHTLEEAYEIFCSNPLYYQEDLMWMTPKPFCFYLPVFLRYLKSEDSDGDSGAISFVASVLEFQLAYAEDISSAFACIDLICQFVLDHFKKFEDDFWIYGDLRAKYQAIRNQVASKRGG